jgi:transcriptional regulator with XRE-family HTH domain
MKITVTNTDEAVLEEIGTRLQRLRLERNLTQAELAREAGVSKITVERLEAGQPAKLQTLIRVLRVLGLLAGLNPLLPEPMPSPIETVRLRGKTRQRASGARRNPDSSRQRGGKWTWGDQSTSGAR